MDWVCKQVHFHSSFSGDDDAVFNPNRRYQLVSNCVRGVRRDIQFNAVVQLVCHFQPDCAHETDSGHSVGTIADFARNVAAVDVFEIHIPQ